MTPKEKYGQCTEQGCRETLNQIYGLDDLLTIGELRVFLENREKEANEKMKSEKEKLIKDTVGKCFKIVFSKKHTVLLKIDDVDVIEEYGSPEAILKGEQIVSYDGQLRHDLLKDSSDKKYSNFFPADSNEEISASEFEKVRNAVKYASNLI